MSYLSAIIQGIIQGFTEFLPVSSSGHLSLYQYFTGTSSEGSLLFSVMLHFGTLAAVIIAFWPTVWQLFIEFLSIFADLFTGKLFRGYPKPYRRMLYFLMLSCVPLLVVPFIQDLIEGFSTDNSIIAEGCFFLVTALLLTLADKAVKGVKNVLFGGEGLFNTVVTGPGRILLQTMPMSAFAGAIASVLPSKG